MIRNAVPGLAVRGMPDRAYPPIGFVDVQTGRVRYFNF